MTSQSTDAGRFAHKDTAIVADGDRTECSHTPGPWKLCHHLQNLEKDASCPCGYRGGIWGSDGEHIVCEMGSQPIPGQEGMEPPRYPRPVELANARLIAAAPDLLNACEAAEEWLSGWGSAEPYLSTIRAALALAKASLSTDANASPTDGFLRASLNPSPSSKGGA